MALTSGTRLGPYEIQSPLGAGGMGEVYRARDTRLDRTVAVKVLPKQFQSDPDLKARFDREARSISWLQHANVCTLFDVGHQDGIDYLVMECLEGETLAARLVRGPMPIDQALKVGIEIADALDKAHRRGIIHRDLKPGNIMLTKSGSKLMDFGLARGRAVPAAMPVGTAGGPLTPSTPMNVAALTSPAAPLTQKGSIVGTFQYMAPEVLQGAEADARSDIFGFGCLMYEMTTGKRAFDGKSQVGVLAAILEKDPESISTAAPMAPPALDRLIRTCLAKEPEQRWQSAHDLKLQLETISELGSRAGIPAVVGGMQRKPAKTILAAAGWIVALGAIVAAAFFFRGTSTPNGPVRAEIELPPGAEMQFSLAGGVAISPDSTKLAFAAQSGNAIKLWIRDLETGKTWSLNGADGATFPFWSADSRSVGFFSDGKLRTVAATGGPVQILADAPAGRGGSWSQAGVILFTPNIQEPLYTVPEAGGTPKVATKLGKEGHTHRNPHFLPDGQHFLFTERAFAALTGDLYAGSLDGSAPKLLIERASNAVYTQGYLLYLRDRNLLAQHFDPKSLTLSGNPIPVTENIEYWGPKDLGNFSVSSTGTLMYRTADASQMRFAWLKLPGKETEEFGDPISGIELTTALPSLRISPNGKKIAFMKRDPTSPEAELWIFDVDRRTSSRQSFSAPGGIYSAFSPDSSRIAVASSSGVTSALAIRTLATGRDEKLDIGATRLIYVDSWTPDGKYLIMMAQDPKTLFDLFAFPVAGGAPIPLLTQPYNEYEGEVSPNGKWLAYLSNESNRPELYVTDFSGAHAKFQVSSDGANWHAWSRDGKHLYFANGGKLLAAEIRNPATLELGNAETVTTLDAAQPVAFAPDGRLLILKQVSGDHIEPLHIVLNFPKTLGQ
jgi:Tol biopolymer transport system component